MQFARHLQSAAVKNEPLQRLDHDRRHGEDRIEDQVVVGAVSLLRVVGWQASAGC